MRVEATFEGTMFTSSEVTIKHSSSFVTITYNQADWHFMEKTPEKKEKDSGSPIIYFLSVRVPHSKVKKLGHLL